MVGGMPDLEQIAARAWLYGYPLVLMDTTRRVRTGHEAVNTFHHTRSFPDYTYTDVVMPNADTLYSAAWLDLRAEPVVLTMPEMAGRYHMVPMLSGWTDVFFSPGSRTTGDHGGEYAICGPGFRGPLPDGLTRVDAPTALVSLGGRISTLGTRDYLAVHALQDQLQLVPLSRYAPEAPAPVTVPDLPSTQDFSAPVDQVARLDGAAFFGRLAWLLGDNPPRPEDREAVAWLERLGVVSQPADEPLQPRDPEVAEAIAGAPSAGQTLLRQAGERADAERANGWTIRRGLGDYGTDYGRRAQVALTTLGANLDADAVYPRATVDEQGHPLSGGHRYLLRFAPGDLPPVRGFWSLTLYNDKQYFVDNELDRYAISDRDDLVPSMDGSVEILIQHDDPGENLRSNWLPAPTGSFNVILRAYWPEQSILNGAWAPPPLVRMS